jgi:hypothetical protein
MDKQLVGELPDITQSSNDNEIMVITNSEYNQLKKEKISDFLTDMISKDETNALIKGADNKLFVTNFGNADNITSGTIDKDRLPAIEVGDLPDSGVIAETYPYPVNLQVNQKGQVVSVEAGEPGANNANTDLSNITEAGKAVINHFSTSIGDPIITLSNTLGDNEIWLEGGTVSRTTYAELFAIYGTTYGAGDGSTTFVLPDFRNRAVWGSNNFGYIAAGLPNHSHQATLHGINIQTTWGAGFILINAPQYTVQNIQTTEASTNNPIYKSGSTVQPPSIKVRVKTRYK